jgi:hypothetical protein
MIYILSENEKTNDASDHSIFQNMILSERGLVLLEKKEYCPEAMRLLLEKKESCPGAVRLLLEEKKGCREAVRLLLEEKEG